MSQIVVIGSLNTDMVMKMRHLPKPGETVLANSFYQNSGGKGGNQAVAAARSGGNVTILAAIGDDAAGNQLRANLEKEGIETNFISMQLELHSGIAFIQVDEAGENSIVVNPGANAGYQPEMLRGSEPILSAAKVLLASLEIPVETVEMAMQLAGKETIKILNPAPASPLPDSLLKLLDWITPNETETEILTNIRPENPDRMKAAANYFHVKGIKNCAITLGEKGVFVSTGIEQFQISAPIVNAIDTTAAGDVFNGCLAAALAEGMTINDAVNFATRAASLSVTRAGAQDSAPYKEEI